MNSRDRIRNASTDAETGDWHYREVDQWIERFRRREKMRWHIELARRYLPALPLWLTHRGRRCRLDIEPGRVSYLCGVTEVISFRAEHTGEAARAMCGWLDSQPYHIADPSSNALEKD